MMPIIIYSISVFVILILYYFYKPQDQQQQISTQQQQQQQQPQIDNLDQSADLLSISSTASGTIIINNNSTENNNDSSIDNQNSLNNNNISDLNNINNLNNNLMKFSYCYTYTNYKVNGNYCKNKINNNDDALIVELIKKYFNKNNLFKYLGLNTTINIARNNENYILNQQIYDSFKTFNDLILELNKIGLIQYNIIIGVDFTASNEWKGRKTFNSQSLHKILGNKIYNPYQKILSILGNVFNNMNIKLHAFGFGDRLTKNETIFSFNDYETEGSNESFKSFDEILQRYNTIVKKISLSSPTSFAPIINKSIDLVKKTNEYHILFIISDGKLSDENELETIKSIEFASNYALSIVMIGVGDGPWDTMMKFDDKLINRKFDNFQFVDFHRIARSSKTYDLKFALNALMEIPEQYKCIKRFGYV